MDPGKSATDEKKLSFQETGKQALAEPAAVSTDCCGWEFTSWVLLFGVAYYASAQVGLWLSVPEGTFVTFWPPAGVYLAVLALTDPKRWWAIMLMALPSNLLFDLARSSDFFWPSLGFFAVNTGVAATGAGLLRRFGLLHHGFSSLRQVLILACASAVLTALGAVVGTAVVWVRFRAPLIETWVHWWFADLVGLWFTGPLVFRVAQMRSHWRDARPSIGRVLEFTVLTASVLVVAKIVFGDWLEKSSFTALMLPFAMWAVLRFGSLGVKMAMLIVAIVSLRGAIQLQGPIAGMSPNVAQAVLHTQYFLYVWSVFLHAVAAILVERKQANDELQRINAELAYRVEDRTAELREANRALQENNRRKDDFLAMLAHELRNPLAPIMNAIHILQPAHGLSADGRLAVDMIERQVRHMARLVDDLLDVARIGRGKIQVNRHHTDLVRILREVAADHRPVLEERGLTFLVDLPDSPLWIDGDDTRLAQMVGNLLHNANKFTERGGLVVLRAAVEGTVALVRVCDTGIGMSPETQAHVFEAFSQADNSLVRSHGGLGLGLALVQGLVQLHGGDVQAESAGVGCGTTFTLKLPLYDPPETVRVDDHASTAVPMQAMSQRVLIIEDNQDAAASMKTLLDMRGYSVQVAHSGPDGVELAQRFRPEVVICDIGLPGMDGYQVCEQLRQHPETRDAFLISQSGYGQRNDVSRAERVGFDVHLTKPVDFAQLEQVLASTSNGGASRFRDAKSAAPTPTAANSNQDRR